MRKLWRGIVRTVFWSYERGSWPYDVMVLAILAFVLLTPRNWFHDRPQVNPQPQNSVRLISEGPDRTRIYRIDADLLDPQKNASDENSALETQIRAVLSRNVVDLKSQTFDVSQIVAVHRNDGSVRSYDVTVRR